MRQEHTLILVLLLTNFAVAVNGALISTLRLKPSEMQGNF